MSWFLHHPLSLGRIYQIMKCQVHWVKSLNIWVGSSILTYVITILGLTILGYVFFLYPNYSIGCFPNLMIVLSIPTYICILCATQDSISTEIGNLLNLEWLDLSSNVMSGTHNNNIGVFSLLVSQLIQCSFSQSYVCFFYFKIALHVMGYPGRPMVCIWIGRSQIHWSTLALISRIPGSWNI